MYETYVRKCTAIGQSTIYKYMSTIEDAKQGILQPTFLQETSVTFKRFDFKIDKSISEWLHKRKN